MNNEQMNKMILDASKPDMLLMQNQITIIKESSKKLKNRIQALESLLVEIRGVLSSNHYNKEQSINTVMDMISGYIFADKK